MVQPSFRSFIHKNVKTIFSTIGNANILKVVEYKEINFYK